MKNACRWAARIAAAMGVVCLHIPIEVAAGPSLALGSQHGCESGVNGRVRCWGNNSSGQLGNGGRDQSNSPVFAALSAASNVTAGHSHTCAVLNDGMLSCWGYLQDGILGSSFNSSPQPNSSLPVAISGIGGAVSVATGFGHVCALLGSGGVRCWGNNSAGQLGDGTTTHKRSERVAVTGVSDAVEVTAANLHTCARLAEGTVRCWGYNAYGQLGDDTYVSRSTPVTVAGVTNAVDLAAGSNHTCAALSDGTARCWGFNAGGQLGDGTQSERPAPVNVVGMDGAVVVAVAAGDNHSCALLANGSVRCWGSNFRGQLGDGSTVGMRLQPVAVVGINNAIGIAAGGDTTCARLINEEISCWGSESSGQLGRDSSAARTTPASTQPPLTSAVAIDASYLNSCAVLTSGGARCWGDNGLAQLGNGSYTTSAVPATVNGIAGAINVGFGVYHGCVVLSTGSVRCWGRNHLGQLGNGMTSSTIFASAPPVTVVGIDNAKSVAAANNHSCALLASGHVGCWGDNAAGQLGDGSRTSRSAPVKPVGLNDAVEVATGLETTCAVLGTGSLSCWGIYGFWVRSGGSLIRSDTPVLISSIANAKTVGIGHSHACVSLVSGEVKCWGQNGAGQLGAGVATAFSLTPLTVSGISGATRVVADGDSSCALLSSGAVRCWGSNARGQLGDGTMESRSSPVGVVGVSDATGITLGDDHACAISTTRGVICWGEGGNGERGDGYVNRHPTPVPLVSLQVFDDGFEE